MLFRLLLTVEERRIVAPAANGDGRVGANVVAISALQTNAPPAIRARTMFANQNDASRIERADQLHERVDVAADDALARFHSLDRRDRESGLERELPLIDSRKGARRSKLCRRYHRVLWLSSRSVARKGWDRQSDILHINYNVSNICTMLAGGS